MFEAAATATHGNNYLVLDDRTRTETALSWLRESGIKPPAA